MSRATSPDGVKYANSKTQEHTYKHPWEIVIQGYLRRYPTNPMNPILAETKVIEDGRVPGTDIVKTVRICTVHIEANFMVKKALGVSQADYLQITAMNAKERWLQLATCNMTLSGSGTTFETCSWTVHPENPEWTYFTQTASLHINSLFGLESIAETLALKSWVKNCAKGRAMDQAMIDAVLAEGYEYKDELLAEKYPELTKSAYTWNPLDATSPEMKPIMADNHQKQDMDTLCPEFGKLRITDAAALDAERAAEAGATPAPADTPAAVVS